MIRYFTTKPKILIKEYQTVGFTPSRAVWIIKIENEGRAGWQRFIFGDRKSLTSCYIEAVFILEDEIPSLPNKKAAIAEYGRNEQGGTINLESDSPYEIEFISKMHGELGFHIKDPTEGTFLVTKEALAIVTVRKGERIIAKATWGIFLIGKWCSDLDFERLE